MSNMKAPDAPAPKRRWFQFSLRGLFLAIAIGALIVWGGQRFLDWYQSVPLADEVASFNAREAGNQFRRMVPLTEEQVVVAIESQLPIIDASQPVNAIYSRIVRTRRLPRGASLSTTGRPVTPNSREFVPWVDLDVMTGKRTGYTLKVREMAYSAVPTDPATKP